MKRVFGNWKLRVAFVTLWLLQTQEGIGLCWDWDRWVDVLEHCFGSSHGWYVGRQA